jgi:SNF2 family DNA or RNA helicase
MEVKVTRASPTLLAVRFAYDEEVITAVKSIPGRTWNKANHVWVIPSSPENVRQLRKLMPHHAKLLVETKLLADLEAQEAGLAKGQAVRDAGDSAIAFDYVTAPYAHQRAGLEFLVHLGSGALLWEMGLGKTKTAIDYAEYLEREAFESHVGSTKVLVITPNTVKRNWGAEIEKHAGHTAYIIPDGTLPKRAKAFGTARYTIVNAEALSYAVTAGALQAITWDLVIVDESTRFKTPSAQRTKALHKLRATQRIILTGTPITGKPEDAWSQLEFVSPGLFGSFYSFRDRYLQLDYFRKPVGVKPGMAQDLVERVARRSYRILKRDVLDLPEKVYANRVVELSGEQAKAYKQMRDELRVEIENAPKFTATNILTVLLRLTQITAGLVGTTDSGYLWLPDSAKLAELDNLLLDELAGEQVVIFGQYQRELEELAKRYVGEIPGWHPIIYGPTPEKVRHELVDEFQRGARRLLFCQNRTGGIGINLTAAQVAVYYTRSWSLEEWLQSQDRLHRIGQRGTVSILSLVAKDTIDEEIAKALAAKQNIADYLTGDKARQLAARLLGGH